MFPVAYVAGPYRSDQGINGIHANIQKAREVAVQLWQMGFAAICPHMNTAMMDGPIPLKSFLDGDLEILRRCDLIIMVPGWEGSSRRSHTATSVTWRPIAITRQSWQERWPRGSLFSEIILLSSPL